METLGYCCNKLLFHCWSESTLLNLLRTPKDWKQSALGAGDQSPYQQYQCKAALVDSCWYLIWSVERQANNAGSLFPVCVLTMAWHFIFDAQ